MEALVFFFFFLFTSIFHLDFATWPRKRGRQIPRRTWDRLVAHEFLSLHGCRRRTCWEQSQKLWKHWIFQGSKNWELNFCLSHHLSLTRGSSVLSRTIQMFYSSCGWLKSPPLPKSSRNPSLEVGNYSGRLFVLLGYFQRIPIYLWIFWASQRSPAQLHPSLLLLPTPCSSGRVKYSMFIETSAAADVN